MQSLTARMPLLAATSAFGLGRRRWSSPQQCYLRCLCTNMSNTNEKHIDFCPLSKIMAAGASRLLASRVQSVKEGMQITEPSSCRGTWSKRSPSRNVYSAYNGRSVKRATRTQPPYTFFVASRP